MLETRCVINYAAIMPIISKIHGRMLRVSPPLLEAKCNLETW